MIFRKSAIQLTFNSKDDWGIAILLIYIAQFFVTELSCISNEVRTAEHRSKNVILGINFNNDVIKQVSKVYLTRMIGKMLNTILSTLKKVNFLPQSVSLVS